MKNNNEKRKKSFEFSKLLVSFSLIAGAIITVFGSYMAYVTQDTSIVVALITAIFTDTGAALGFYFNKAKAENRIKIKEESIRNTLKLREQYKDADIAEAEQLEMEANSTIDDTSQDELY